MEEEEEEEEEEDATQSGKISPTFHRHILLSFLP